MITLISSGPGAVRTPLTTGLTYSSPQSCISPNAKSNRSGLVPEVRLCGMSKVKHPPPPTRWLALSSQILPSPCPLPASLPLPFVQVLLLWISSTCESCNLVVRWGGRDPDRDHLLMPQWNRCIGRRNRLDPVRRLLDKSRTTCHPSRSELPKRNPFGHGEDR